MFTTLTEDEERELWRLYRLYWREAVRCEKAKAYLAGCIMLGSALEALLVLTVNCYDEDALITGRAPTKKGQPKPLLDWDLAHLLNVAKAAKWLPSGLDENEVNWQSRKAKVGDIAEIVRALRNLVHPGRYRKEHFRGRVTNTLLRQQFQIVDGCRGWLKYHNNQALLQHLKEAGED